MKQQRKQWEKKRKTKEGKHFWGMYKQKKKNKVRNNLKLKFKIAP